MKLLFVNGHLQIGGVEKSLVNLLNAIDYSKHQVDLLLFEGLGEYKNQLPEEVNVIKCDLTKTYGSFFSSVGKALVNREFSLVYWKIALTLRSKLGPQWIKIVRLFYTAKSYDCAIAYRVGICSDYVGFAVKAKKKYMWWHHGDFSYDNHTVSHWQRTSKELDAIVCVSQSTKDLIYPYFKKYVKNFYVIPNMLPQDEILKKSVMFHPYENEKDTVLVSVGRMSPEKKMKNVVFAMDLLLKNHYTNVKWFIVGDGAEFSDIQNLIKERHLENKVICVGRQENPYPYIAGADLFVHTSFVESQGLAVLEAMALGVPCVVTKSLGVMEFVKDASNALLAEQSVESMTEKIIQFLNSAEIASSMHECQKNTVENFSPRKIIHKLTKLLGE